MTKLTKTINIEVYKKDAPRLMNFIEAVKCAENLGKGWRLPTIEELNLIYENKNEIKGLNTSGSLPDGWYWSSSPGYYHGGYARCQRLSDGYQSYDNRRYGLSVRLVRGIRDR